MLTYLAVLRIVLPLALESGSTGLRQWSMHMHVSNVFCFQFTHKYDFASLQQKKETEEDRMDRQTDRQTDKQTD